MFTSKKLEGRKHSLELVAWIRFAKYKLSDWLLMNFREFWLGNIVFYQISSRIAGPNDFFLHCYDISDDVTYIDAPTSTSKVQYAGLKYRNYIEFQVWNLVHVWFHLDWLHQRIVLWRNVPIFHFLLHILNKCYKSN